MLRLFIILTLGTLTFTALRTIPLANAAFPPAETATPVADTATKPEAAQRPATATATTVRVCGPFDYDMIEVEPGTTLSAINMKLPILGVNTFEALSDTSSTNMGAIDWRIMATDQSGTVEENTQDIKGYFKSITSDEINKFLFTLTPTATSEDVTKAQQVLIDHLKVVTDYNQSLSSSDLLNYPDFFALYDKEDNEARTKDKERVAQILYELPPPYGSILNDLIKTHNQTTAATKPHLKRPTFPTVKTPNLGTALPAICSYISYNTFEPIDKQTSYTADIQLETLVMDQIAIEAIKSDSYKKSGTPPATVLLANGNVACRIHPSVSQNFVKRTNAKCTDIEQKNPVIRATRQTTQRYLQFGGKAYWTTCSSLSGGDANLEWSVGELKPDAPYVARASDSTVLSALMQEPAYNKAFTQPTSCPQVQEKLKAYVQYIEDKTQRDKPQPFTDVEKGNYQKFCADVIAKGVVNCDLAVGTPAPTTVTTPDTTNGVK